MQLSNLLTTTAFTLLMIAAGGVVAYAQSDSTVASEATPEASAPAQESHSKGRGIHHWNGRRHGKRGLYGNHFSKRASGEMFRGLFNEIDVDGSGSITQEEIDIYRANKLAEFDTSGDGALSIEEFDEFYRELTRSRMVRAFQRLDADGDGVITSEEMNARFGNIVARMDRDGTGALSIRGHGHRK